MFRSFNKLVINNLNTRILTIDGSDPYIMTYFKYLWSRIVLMKRTLDKSYIKGAKTELDHEKLIKNISNFTVE